MAGAVSPEAIEAEILQRTAERGPGKSICPVPTAGYGPKSLLAA